MKDSILQAPHIYAASLNCVLPLYTTLRAVDVENILQWYDTGGPLQTLPVQRDEKWVMDACRQLSGAEQMAEKWLHISLTQLHRQRLEGLDDFLLATYAAVLKERDHESDDLSQCTDGWHRICDSYATLLANPDGTILLNYSNLYSDMLQFRMVRSKKEYWELHDTALSHEYGVGTAEKALELVIWRMTDLIADGLLMEGASGIARILHEFPNDFRVYQAAIGAFFDVGETWIGQMLLTAAADVPRDKLADIDYNNLCFVYNREKIVRSATTRLEKMMLNAVARDNSNVKPDGVRALVRELVPQIESIPVKRIPDWGSTL